MKTNNKAAFTLVELVLAIALTVLVIFAASAATRSIFDINSRIKTHDLAVSQAIFSLNSISKDLSNIYREKVDGRYCFYIDSSGAKNIASDRLKFYRVSDPVSSEDTSCLDEIEYGLLKNQSKQINYRLGKRIAPVNDKTLGNSKGKVFALADNVKSLYFECWDGVEWIRNVPQDGYLPKMIRVVIELDCDLWATGNSTISKQISLLPVPAEERGYEKKY